MKTPFIPLRVLNSKERKRILQNLQEQFGIEEVEGIILQKGKERIFLYQGSLSADEIIKIETLVPIERIGMYFGKIVEDRYSSDNVRMSIEGTQLLKDQIKKNIFELNEDQADKWMKGQDLEIKSGLKGFVVMKYKEEFLGCGKASEEKIGNFIPKNRRLRDKNIIQ